jgi:hypothetical protein
MQALKQAAREGDSVKLEAVCEEWSVPAAQTEVAEKSGRPTPPQAEEAGIELPSAAEARR